MAFAGCSELVRALSESQAVEATRDEVPVELKGLFHVVLSEERNVAALLPAAVLAVLTVR